LVLRFPITRDVGDLGHAFPPLPHFLRVSRILGFSAPPRLRGEVPFQICGKKAFLSDVGDHGDLVGPQVFNHHFLAISAILAIPGRRMEADNLKKRSIERTCPCRS
jgi:hypothetical protein